jgi:hypothetical protein
MNIGNGLNGKIFNRRKGKEREVNAEAQSCKDAGGKPRMNMDSLVHGMHGTGGDSRATPPISTQL